MANLQVYAGDGFEVTYDPAVCAHSGECARGLPEVFDPEAKPWIRPERAPAARLAEVVARCPSGALRFVAKAAAAAAPARSTVSLKPNGPLLLSGDFEIRAPDGTVLFAGQKAALCRCGHSANKPFCDGSHKGAGFQG
jgi:uncharacterized Fe-S cluster protein YjdI